MDVKQRSSVRIVKVKITLLFLILGFLFSFSSSLIADDDDLMMRLGYRSKRGLGYKYGYGTLGLFYTPSNNWDHCQPIVDVRVHRIDTGHIASNAGLGVRKRICDHIFGVNAFYDFRDTRLADYHQFGVGSELFTPCFDIRFNAYFPISPRRRHHNTIFFLGDGFRATRHLREFTSHMAELELGRALGCFSIFSPYIAAGAYYLKSRAKGNAYGVKWRVATSAYRYLNFEVAGAYDHIFKNRVQVYAGVDFPVKKFSRSCSTSSNKCSDSYDDCLKEAIYRNELIILRRSCFWRTNY